MGVNPINDMANLQLKSDKVTPFGGIFSTVDSFSKVLKPTINRSLGLRCKFCGYQYGEIMRAFLRLFRRLAALQTHADNHDGNFRTRSYPIADFRGIRK